MCSERTVYLNARTAHYAACFVSKVALYPGHLFTTARCCPREHRAGVAPRGWRAEPMTQSTHMARGGQCVSYSLGLPKSVAERTWELAVTLTEPHDSTTFPGLQSPSPPPRPCKHGQSEQSWRAVPGRVCWNSRGEHMSTSVSSETETPGRSAQAPNSSEAESSCRVRTFRGYWVAWGHLSGTGV